MLSDLKSTAKGMLERLGLDVRTMGSMSRFQVRMKRALDAHAIDLVFDVGANAGQYGAELYASGYQGKVVSFEPLPEPYGKLVARAASRPGWTVHPRTALGDTDGEVSINVSENSVSSSVLSIQDSHLTAAPNAATVRSEIVPLARLDSVAGGYSGFGNRRFLKMDTQGFEWQVLDGAPEALKNIVGIQTEVSIVELYAGQKLFKDMIQRIEDLGFALWTLEPGFFEPGTGRILQADLVFFRP